MYGSNKLKILALGIILIVNISNSAAISGIHLLWFSSYVSDTEVEVQIEINLTLPYEIYENDSKITNGTLLAYTVAKIITPRNSTPGIINWGIFINRTDIDFTEYFWLNFSYGNLPLVPEFGEQLNKLGIILGFTFLVIILKLKKKRLKLGKT